jgi:HAD superfamily hydrolase (TIGR01509 family)
MKINSWQPRALIFDMDGLLVDSEPVWAIAEDAMLEVRGRQPDSVFRTQIIGLRTNEFLGEMRRFYELEDTVDSLRADVLNRMLELIPQRVVPRPGALELLEYVAAHNLPRAIASSSPMPVIDAVVQSQGWEKIFTVRCSGDEVAQGKPAPDVYLLAAARLNVAPSDCLALEDSPTGARAAVAAGMVCYAVPDPSHTRVDAFRGITDHVYDSLHAVLAALNE